MGEMKRLAQITDGMPNPVRVVFKDGEAWFNPDVSTCVSFDDIECSALQDCVPGAKELNEVRVVQKNRYLSLREKACLYCENRMVAQFEPMCGVYNKYKKRD